MSVAVFAFVAGEVSSRLVRIVDEISTAVIEGPAARRETGAEPIDPIRVAIAVATFAAIVVGIATALALGLEGLFEAAALSVPSTGSRAAV